VSAENAVALDYFQNTATESFALSSLEQKSYLAAMDILGIILTGKLWNMPADSGLSSMDTTHRIRILETSLAYTIEMLPLFTLFTSIESPRDLAPVGLAASIQSLFQNMTVSIMFEPALLAPNYVYTVVETDRFHNAYSYSWRRPATACGVAIASTFYAILVACYTILSTGFSYRNKFSTIVRVSRSEKLDVLIAPEDRRGQDPMPEHIARTTFSISDGTELTFGMLSEATKLMSRSPGPSS
jgi:hypothetical protein